jgi:hypothetical protein
MVVPLAAAVVVVVEAGAEWVGYPQVVGVGVGGVGVKII